MYNTDTPMQRELPSAERLFRSTALAAAAAIVLLVTVVLPSEYGIDPTGTGGLLGLTSMGEIKQQLAEEAAADREAKAVAAAANADGPAAATATVALDDARLVAIERRLDEIAAMLATRAEPRAVADAPPAVAAVAPPPPATAAAPAAPPADLWQDEISIVLAPGQGVEFKLVMSAAAEASFEWTANGGVLNFDTHGDGGGRSISYEKGRSVAEDAGVLIAAFDGNHGWFWRNRMDRDVTLTLRTRGDYVALKRTA